ncbi:MAG: uroporphyrinogen-III synthase, partial [Bacillaceae bacterium]|nr:uroporphyrinogen-III synthase [Bacillaceae bacterium]
MSLLGKRVVIAGTRKLEEMSTLIEKQGGEPVIRSLQGTVFLAEKEVEPSLQKLVDEGIDMMIVTTGIGLETLLNISEKIGVKEKFVHLLQSIDVASRGYKSLNVLKSFAITPVAVDKDGTTRGLMNALQNYSFAGKKVAVQLHGDAAPQLIAFLEKRGACVIQLLPYQHTPPEKETVERFCRELIEGAYDAVCFTTAIQVRSLFQYAKVHKNRRIGFKKLFGSPCLQLQLEKLLPK